MPIAVRIAIVVAGFLMIAGAELLDNKHNAQPAATGGRRADTFMDDAKVFTVRIFGAFAIFLGLVSFVIANHLPPR